MKDYDAPENRWEAPDREFLIQKLDEILSKPRSESNGGYAEVSRELQDELDTFFYYVMRAAIEPDPDGDLTLSLSIVNRKKWSNPFDWIRIPHDFDTPDDYVNTIRTLTSVQSMAAGRMDSLAYNMLHNKDKIFKGENEDGK